MNKLLQMQISASYLRSEWETPGLGLSNLCFNLAQQ